MIKTLRNGAFLLFALAVFGLALTGCESENTVSTTVISSGKDKGIISFKIDDAVGAITNNAVSVTVPAGKTLNSLAPVIEISEGATITPKSGETKDFTKPVVYTLVTDRGYVKNYLVTVSVKESSTLELTVGLVQNGNTELEVYNIPATGIKLSTSGKDFPKELVISVGGKYSNWTVYTEVTWYIDGDWKGNDNIITIKAGDYAYTIPHDITIVAVKNNVRYSKTLTFTVVR